MGNQRPSAGYVGQLVSNHQQSTPQEQHRAYLEHQHQHALLQQHQTAVAQMSRSSHPTLPATAISPYCPPQPQQSQQPSASRLSTITLNGTIDRLIATLSTNQQSASARIEQLGSTIDTLATQFEATRKQSQEQSKQVSVFLDKSNAIHTVTCRVLGNRLEKLEKMIGTGYDKGSLSQRLDGVLFAVEELLERVKDPEAASQGVHREIGTSPMHRTYADVEIDPRTPSPEPRISLPPEPEPRVWEERGTSPLQKRYVDVANDTSPTPPRSPSSTTRSIGVATSPTPGVNHQLSIAASRRYSDALTLVGDASNTEIKPNLGMDIDYHDKTEIVGLDTAQAPTDYVDTGSVPQTEQEHSSPSPLTPNLSPATWPHRPPPIRPTRATIRGRDEKTFSMFNPSVIPSGSQPGQLTSFMETLRRSACVSLLREEEEEESEAEAEAEKVDQKQRQGQEQAQEVGHVSLSAQPSGGKDGEDVHNLGTTEYSGETEEVLARARVETAGEVAGKHDPRSSPSMLTPVPSTPLANPQNTFLSPVASISVLSSGHTPTPTSHPQSPNSPEIPIQPTHDASSTETHSGPKPTSPPAPPTQLAHLQNRNDRSGSTLFPSPTAPTLPQLSPEMHVPSFHDSPSDEELFGYMEDGLSSPHKIWGGVGDDGGGDASKDGGCVKGVGAHGIMDEDDSPPTRAGAVLAGHGGEISKGAGVTDQDDPLTAGGTVTGDVVPVPTDMGTGSGLDDISYSPVPDSDEEELSVSKLITEAFASSPGLDAGGVVVGRGSGRGSGEREQGSVGAAGAVTGPHERERSPEIPLPRSSLSKLYEPDSAPEVSPPPSRILEYTEIRTVLQSESDLSPEASFLRSSIPELDCLRPRSRPLSRSRSRILEHAEIGTGAQRERKLSREYTGTGKQKQKQKDQGSSKKKVLYEGVDGPVFDSDSDRDLDLPDRARSPAPTPRTRPHPITQAPDITIPESNRGLLSQNFGASTASVPIPIPNTHPKPKSKYQGSLFHFFGASTASNPTPTPSTHPKPKSKSLSKPPWSPIYVPSRSLSPISTLSSSSMEEDQAAVGNSDDSDVLILPIKRKKYTKTGVDGEEGGVKPPTSPVIVVAKRKLNPKLNGELGSKGGAEESGSAPPALDAPMLKKKLLQLKNVPDGRSIAATKVKKRKIYTMDKVEEKDAETKMKQQPASVSASAQSMAATRVKKRKANEREMMMEPPLKRVKFLSARAKESGAESSSKGKGKEKEQALSPKKGRPSKAKGIKWPPKMKVGEGRRKFVECVKCFRWYHYGCVGNLPMDLDVDDLVCPPCQAGGANPLIATKGTAVCARPNCGEEAQPGEFFVTGILGRSTKVQGGVGRKYQWLLKWDGYPVEEATWEDEESMTDPQRLIEYFEMAALNEGLTIDDPYAMILLREAVEAGWNERSEAQMNA